AFLSKQFSQSAQTRTDFDDVISRTYLCLIDDPAREIWVVQKILSESFDRRDFYFPKRRANLGELHVYERVTTYLRLLFCSQKFANKICWSRKLVHKLFTRMAHTTTATYVSHATCAFTQASPGQEAPAFCGSADRSDARLSKKLLRESTQSPRDRSHMSRLRQPCRRQHCPSPGRTSESRAPLL